MMSVQNGYTNGSGARGYDGGLSLTQNPHAKLAQYFEDVMGSTELPVESVSIYQKTVGGSSFVRKLQVGAIDPDDLARRIMNIVESDNAGMLKQTSYIVEAMARSMNGEPAASLGREIIIVDGKASNALGESEPPNEAGYTSQIMRHAESTYRQSHIVTAFAITKLEEENVRLTTRVRELESASMESQAMRVKAMVEIAEIEGKRESAKAVGEAKSQLYKSFARYAPMALDGLITQSRGGDDHPVEKLRTFLMSVSQEEQMAVLLSFARSNREKVIDLLHLPIDEEARKLLMAVPSQHEAQDPPVPTK